MPLRGRAVDDDIARWLVVAVGDRSGGSGSQRFSGATSIGVGDSNGNGLTDLILRGNKGFGCGTGDVGAIGFPLIGEVTEPIGISDFGDISSKGFSLGGGAADGDAPCWAVVDICECQ